MQNRRYIDVLKIVCAFAVVMMHTNVCFWTFSTDSYWLSANIIESICFFSVPVFFMISGATLLDYRDRYSTKEFLKKRFFRTFIPFLFWSLIGMVWCFTVSQYEFHGVLDAIQNIFLAKYVDIYWFFIPLFVLYLAIPFLSLIPKENRQWGFGWVIVSVLTLNFLLPFLASFGLLTYSSFYYFPVASEYAIYLLLGYWIDRYELKLWHRIIIYILAIAAVIFTAVSTRNLSYAANAVTNTYKSYTILPCIVYSSGIFVLFKYAGRRCGVAANSQPDSTPSDCSIPQSVSASTGCSDSHSGRGSFIKSLSGLVFGVYLVHWFVLQIALKFSPLPNTSLVFRLVGSIIIFALSAFIVWLLKKIPIVKNIVP